LTASLTLAIIKNLIIICNGVVFRVKMSKVMLCNICKKNEAVARLTQNVNGKVIELDICQKCVEKKGLKPSKPFNIADVLVGMSNFDVDENEARSERKCARCGVSFASFKKSGKLGCENCYVVFDDFIKNILKRIHGRNKHVGKMLNNLVNTEKVNGGKIVEYKQMLAQAIAEERYEEAAKLRDKMKELGL
jgi:protein arginine kinase activator